MFLSKFDVIFLEQKFIFSTNYGCEVFIEWKGVFMRNFEPPPPSRFSPVEKHSQKPNSPERRGPLIFEQEWSNRVTNLRAEIYLQSWKDFDIRAKYGAVLLVTKRLQGYSALEPMTASAHDPSVVPVSPKPYASVYDCTSTPILIVP